MARPRFDKLEPDKQEALLTAAALEFAEHGYRGASLNRIIERVGSSKGSFYYYFDDKADLLRTVVERAVGRAMEEVQMPSLESFTAENYWERVRSIALESVPLMEQDTWWMRIMRSFYRLRDEPAAVDATAHVLDMGRDLTRSFFGRGQELGVVRTDLPLEFLVEVYLAADQAGDRWMLRHWDAMTESQRRELVAGRADLARDMLDARHMGGER